MQVPEVLSSIATAAQAAVCLAVLALVLIMIWQLLGIRRNNVQLEVEVAVVDPGTNQLTGELRLTLQNMGRTTQRLRNVFIEVRESRHSNRNGVTLVAPVNVISPALGSMALEPAVRETLAWSFDMPSDVRLIRAVAFIDTGRRFEGLTLPPLSQEFFSKFRSGRFTTRLFEV